MLDEIIKLIISVGFVVSVTIIGRLMCRPARRDGQRAFLRYNYQIVGIAGVFTLFAAGFAIVVVATKGPQDGNWYDLLAIIGVLALISAASIYEVYRRQVTLDNDGITARRWFASRTVLWTEVNRIENSGFKGGFVVYDLTGKVRIEHQLVGLEWFIEECRKRLDPEVYGAALDKPIGDRMLW